MLQHPEFFRGQCWFTEKNTVEQELANILIGIDHYAGFRFIAENTINFALHEMNLWLLPQRIETKIVKIDAADQLVLVGPDLEFVAEALTMEPQLLPFTVYHRLKKSFAFFPETPGAVIAFFCIAVHQQNLLVGSQARTNQLQ